MMPRNEKAWGRRLRQIRKAMNLTQVEFGQLLGVSGAYISGLEGGLKTAGKPLLLLMEHKLRINHDFLINGTAPMLLKKSKKGGENKPKRRALSAQEHLDRNCREFMTFFRSNKKVQAALREIIRKFFVPPELAGR